MKALIFVSALAVGLMCVFLIGFLIFLAIGLISMLHDHIKEKREREKEYD